MAGYRLTSDVLDPLPGVVLCISIGLAADDTIHLVNRWRELRRLHPDRPATEALVEAVVTVRRAMVSSSVVLVAGFLALALSRFGWNQQLGILGSVVLILALGSDLLFGVAGLALYARRVERRQRSADDLGPRASAEVASVRV
jgi:predicted RND superfamily exporter protein